MIEYILRMALILTARITYYVLTGYMANGNYTHSGAVACSSDLYMGSIVRIGEDRYMCEDRGLLGNGYPYSHIDIWVDSHEAGQYLIWKYGEYSIIEVENNVYGE